MADSARTSDVMVGVEGWCRWGAWAAHFFVNGAQLCKTHHSYAEGGMARGLPPQPPARVDLSPHGVPYGKVCQRCLRFAKRQPSTVGDAK